MDRYDYAVFVAENTGFTTEQIEGIKPIMQLVLEKAEDKLTPFVSHSWLLHPSIKAVCKPESNMSKFYDCFHIVYSFDEPQCGNLWRVFGGGASFAYLALLPEKTTLQRSLKAYLLNGGKMGQGYGCVPA